MKDDLFHHDDDDTAPSELSPYIGSHQDCSSKLSRASSLYTVPTTAAAQAVEGLAVKPSWRHLFAFTTWSHSTVLCSALVAAGVTAGIKTYLAVALGEIFDIITDFGRGTKTGPETLDHVSSWCYVLVGLGAANWLASTVFLALSVSFGELQAQSARKKVYDSMMKKDLAWYDSLDQGISSLLVRIQTQTRELQLATSQVLGLLVADIMTSIASLTIAFYYSWKLTLILLATFPISILVLFLTNRKIEPAIQVQKGHLSAASKYVTASLTGIDLVKVFNGYDEDLWKYYCEVREAARAYLLQAGCASIQMGYVQFWVVTIFIANFWYGLVLVNQGMAAGNVITTFYSALAGFQGLEGLMPQWLVLSKGVSAGALLKGLAMEDEPGSSPHGSPTLIEDPEHCTGVVEMTNVAFCYSSSPEKEVLKQSNYIFPAGEVTFIVGRSGSGKSTLGSLIAGLYPLTSGEVVIDGRPLRSLDKDWVSRNVVLVQQSSVLFSGTVFENIALGHRSPGHATRAEVLAACDAVLLRSMLADMPHGLDTVVGAAGEGLSGGQKQRVALARAWLRNPAVLILDEVTSGLDQVTRALVMDAIRIWRADKTTIIITHDVSQIQPSDFVYVLDDASLVQKGFRRDLEADTDGLFASLTDLQDYEEASGPLHTEQKAQVDTDSSRHQDTSCCTAYGPDFSLLSPTSLKMWRNRRATVCATTGRREQLSNHPPATGPTAAVPDSSENFWEPGRRYSVFVKQLLSLSNDNEKPEQPSRRLSAPLATSHEAVADMKQWDAFSETSTDTDFIFGEAKRQSHVVRVRQRPTNERDTAAAPLNQGKQDNSSGSLTLTVKTIWPSLDRRGRVTFLCGLLLCGAAATATPLFSYCFGQLCGVFWSTGDRMSEGKRWALYLVVIAVVDGLSTAGSHYMMEHAGQTWVHAIRLRAFRRILRQPKRWFDEAKNSPGRVAECLDRNSEEMRNIVGRFMPTFIIGAGMIVISVVWAMTISWKLSLVALSPMPAFVGSVQGYAFVSGKWETKCNRAAEETSAIFTDILLNIRVVKALSLQKYFGDKYGKATSDTLKVGHRRAVYSCVPFGISQSINYPVTALAFYYGTVLAVNPAKDLSLTQVMQVINLLLFGIGTAASLFGNMPQLTLAQATAGQLLDYAQLKIPSNDKPARGRKLSSPLPVEMQRVSFAYSAGSGEHSLKDVSLSLSPGECTAIVGKSGCGKSTLLSLLLGLYSPSMPSSLKFSHKSVERTDPDHLRQMMAYVSQTPFLFPTSIYGNITYGLDEISPYRQTEHVYGAAEAAGLHDYIISLPDGYNTLVGEGGQALSGGQSQRLCIARALVRQPKLLVLDEPTSALDAESADIIRRTIQGLTKDPQNSGGMAIVMATHSKEMMRVADKVVMMENGLSVEEGGYQELLLARGRFAQLVSSGEWTEEHR